VSLRKAWCTRRRSLLLGTGAQTAARRSRGGISRARRHCVYVRFPVVLASGRQSEHVLSGRRHLWTLPANRHRCGCKADYVSRFSREGASETLVLAEKLLQVFLQPQDCSQSEAARLISRSHSVGVCSLDREVRCSRPVLSRWTPALARCTSRRSWRGRLRFGMEHIVDLIAGR